MIKNQWEYLVKQQEQKEHRVEPGILDAQYRLVVSSA